MPRFCLISATRSGMIMKIWLNQQHPQQANGVIVPRYANGPQKDNDVNASRYTNRLIRTVRPTTRTLKTASWT